ncbi:element excision factor XisH family protein [Pseudanabaena galeata UHCC 0370]|jgi:hypothetical protein|uniref:Element excision factor XisH family protein n=1 Tax=Pseudanabaena galeata UHCC 0370 TaxID=3110310 RepID=A0ABU5TGS8_9CYAN|nr:element excision factor XisH family protein [Pseudanabaena galeata]MEA5477276.1 element excision factor XisH family protein [Pseudanabaena galeata UHCC 0370]
MFIREYAEARQNYQQAIAICIEFGDRFLFVDLGVSGFIGIRQGNKQIAIEIKQFRGQSQVNDLEQAIIFIEPIGKLAIAKIPLKLVIVI